MSCKDYLNCESLIMCGIVVLRRCMSALHWACEVWCFTMSVPLSPLSCPTSLPLPCVYLYASRSGRWGCLSTRLSADSPSAAKQALSWCEVFIQFLLVCCYVMSDMFLWINWMHGNPTQAPSLWHPGYHHGTDHQLPQQPEMSSGCGGH